MTLRCLRALAVALLIASATTVNAQQSTNAPAPGVATGQKIGTVIKTAISTAAPGLSSILDLIWSHLKKPDSGSANKTDLQTAASNPDAQKTANQKVTAGFQAKLQPVGQVADELNVIQKFLDPCVTATQELIVIRTKLKDANTDWQTISNSWERAKIQISNLKSVSDTDLMKVRDAYLNLRLSQIRKANDTTVVSISQEVMQKNLDDLKVDLVTLLATLGDMTAVAGYEFAELQADISDLASWAKGSAAGSPTIPKQMAFIKFLDSTLPKAQTLQNPKK